MRFTTSIIWAASTLFFVTASGEAHSNPDPSATKRSGTPASPYVHLQMTRRQLEDKKLRASSKIQRAKKNVPPTSTIPIHGDTEDHQGSQVQKRWNASPFRLRRIHAIANECLGGVRLRVQNIRNLSAGTTDQTNVEKKAWSLLAELQAILALLRGCHAQLRNCEQGPAPSGTPGGGSNGCPSLMDICQIIAQILRELKSCFQQMTTLSNNFPIVRQTCADTLQQSSSVFADMVIVTGEKLGDVIGGVGRIFGQDARYFGNLGFGFSNIPKTLAIADPFGKFNGFF